MDPMALAGVQLAITVVVVGVVLLLGRRQRIRGEAAVTELRAMLNARLEALQQSVEEISIPSTGPVFVPSTPENWESVREQWATCRRQLERAVEASPIRARRTLSALPRDTYEPIIEDLRADGRLDLTTADTLKLMDRRFAMLRRMRTATAEQAEEFSRLFDRATDGLRKL
jgi:hypothetical protein